MSKNVFIHVFAIFVLLWYSFGIIGFNVHTCNASDRIFIVTFLEDMSCSSIHPSHKCGDVRGCCCCSHHAPEPSGEAKVFIDAPDCCTNDYQVLDSTTDVADDAKRIMTSDRMLYAGAFNTSADARTVSFNASMRMYPLSRSCLGAREVHLFCSVWRI